MGKQKMKINKNKTLAILIAMILTMTIAIPIITSSETLAQTTYVSTGKFQTQAFIGALPNPVGVTQKFCST